MISTAPQSALFRAFIPPLAPSIGLSRAASDHAKDQGRSGAIGHTVTDRNDPWDRMSRYGTWQRKAAENISYGSDNARDIVMQQVIDDGMKKGFLKNLKNTETIKQIEDSHLSYILGYSSHNLI
jgi:uncharacterized protein YkwD